MDEQDIQGIPDAPVEEEACASLRHGGAYANLVLPSLLAESGLDVRERAFLQLMWPAFSGLDAENLGLDQLPAGGRA